MTPSPPTAAVHDEPQRHLTLHGTDVVLLGTAHVSPASARAVRTLIIDGAEPFDAVAVELCHSRHRALTEPDRWANTDLFQILRQGKAPMVMASLALGAYQARLAEQFGIEPGAEMRAAVEGARHKGLPVWHIDRDIGITLRRVARRVPWWQRLSLMGGLLGSLLSRDQVTEEEVEQLKQGDILESTFHQFAESKASLYEPLVAERDRYMAARLYQSLMEGSQRRVLAVVGAGHLQGLETELRALAAQYPPETSNPSVARATLEAIVEDLDHVPPRAKWLKLLPWGVVALIITGFVIGFARNPSLGAQLVVEWVVINGGLSALGAVIALAHPLTVVSAFLAAPLTSLNPTIGAGMVTGAVETFLRRPRVGDFSHLRRDTTHLKGWWKNRVTRVLLVFIFSTLGSAVGTYVAGFRLFSQLAGSSS
ncbi:MAG: TraB/GumN family protein [Candidatus Competibacterales bacterium]